MEVESLPGYKKLAEPVSFEIKKGMTEVLSLKVENELLDKGNVEITKVDKDNKSLLAGVVFSVQDEAGTEITKVTTSEDGRATISDLSVGKYKLVEVESLPGYKKLTEPVTFEIKKGMTEVLPLKVENEMVDKGSVEITKVNAESKSVLPGAVFEVRDQDGKTVIKVTTDKAGKATISDLPAGDYTLVEVEAPTGYEKLTEPISVKIEKGMVNPVQLEVLNKLLPGGSGTEEPGGPGTEEPGKPGTTDPVQPEKQLPKTGQKLPVEPYMGALLVMMSFGLLLAGRRRSK